MINNQTLARPYAKAAFELAAETGQSDAWLGMLEQAAAMADVPEVVELIGNPRLTRESKIEALTAVFGENADSSFCSFLSALGENDRLELLPTVYQQFKELKLEAEKTLAVEIETAYELSDEQIQNLAASLSKRLDRTVNPQQVINPALIGGLVIRAGDVVIDGSVRGKLSQLAEALKS